MPWPGQPKPTNMILNAGVLTTGASVLIGATRGGITFNPGRRMRFPEYDGQYAEIAGMHRISGWDAHFRGRVVESTLAFLQKLEPGSTTVTAGTPAISTITPQPAGQMLVSGDYLTDVVLHHRKQDGGLQRVTFAFGLVVDYTLSGEHNNEGIFDIDIVACLGASETDLEKCPYLIASEAAA